MPAQNDWQKVGLIAHTQKEEGLQQSQVNIVVKSYIYNNSSSTKPIVFDFSFITSTVVAKLFAFEVAVWVNKMLFYVANIVFLIIFYFIQKLKMFSYSVKTSRTGKN